MCAAVTQTGWYCPIMRQADLGTASNPPTTCEALESLVAQAQVRQQCANGDYISCDRLSQGNRSVTDTKTQLAVNWGTPVPAPPSERPQLVTQSVTVTSVTTVEAYTGDTKVTSQTSPGYPWCRLPQR